MVAGGFLRHDSVMFSTAKAENLAIDLKLFTQLEY